MMPAPAYTAMAKAVAAYEPEATALVIASPSALLQVLLEAARRGGEAVAPLIREDERQRAVRAERERIARHLDALAANYPEDVFPPGADSRDGISGAAMRHAYRNAARSVREDLSEGDGNG
jgi:hypothetical protein